MPYVRIPSPEIAVRNLNLYVNSLGVTQLCKYMRKEHVQSTLVDGKFRISTIRECREIEETKLIGDAREGVKPCYEHVDHWSSEDGVDLSAQFKSVINLGGGHNNVITNCSIDRGTISSPEGYLICFSKKRCPSLMNEFGYTACVEIRDLQAFFSSLVSNGEIQSRGDFIGISCVHYYDETEIRISPETKKHLHPMQVKRRKYQGQEEVRIAWRPRKSVEQVDPFFVSSRELARSCREVRF